MSLYRAVTFAQCWVPCCIKDSVLYIKPMQDVLLCIVLSSQQGVCSVRVRSLSSSLDFHVFYLGNIIFLHSVLDGECYFGFLFVHHVGRCDHACAHSYVYFSLALMLLLKKNKCCLVTDGERQWTCGLNCTFRTGSFLCTLLYCQTWTVSVCRPNPFWICRNCHKTCQSVRGSYY